MSAPVEITAVSAPAIGIRQYHLGVFVLLWLPHAYLVRRFWFVTDDAFISFRYARNLALGNGLRYNLGEHVPVEGYSNFLWVLVAGVVEFLRADVTFWMPLISAACGTVLLFLVFDLLQRRLSLGLHIASLATLALGFYPPFALWSSSGLETMPFALLIFLTFERLVLRAGGIGVVGAGVCGLLTALIRVEGIAWVLVLAVLAFGVRRRAGGHRVKPFVLFLVILLTGYAAYFGWRWTYYEALLPNTLTAKSGLPLSYLWRGLDYVAVQFLTFLTPFLLLPGTVFGLRRGRRPLGPAIAALAWAFPAYAIAVTGDFMAMGRFLVPGLAFGTVLLAWMLSDLAERWIRGRAYVTLIGVAVTVIGALPAWDYHLVADEVRARFHFQGNMRTQLSEYAQWQYQRRNVEAWTLRGRALRAYAAEGFAPDASMVIGLIGAVGYYSDLFILDVYGLVTPAVARRELPPDAPRSSPGHDKGVGLEFFMDQAPTIVRVGLFAEDTPQAAASRARDWADALRRNWPTLGIQQRYVPDLVRLDQPAQDGRLQYLIVGRLLEYGVDWRQAWAEFAESVDRLAATGEVPVVTVSHEL
ncbi:MAG: hypothetical protein GY842_08065 [bacterium]|nr:hypothetical protein [bacterium]